MVYTVTVTVSTDLPDAQGDKEAICMALERFGKVRVVAVEKEFEQEVLR